MERRGATREPGIVLRPIRLGDSSKIVSVLTPRFGRVKLVAKGSRQIGSRWAALLEPGNELEVIIHPHPDRELWMLADASLVRAALTGGNTLNKLSHLFAAMELADRLLPEREPVPEFERLYRGFMRAWHRAGDEEMSAVFFALEMGLLEGAGTGFDPERCSGCGRSLQGAERVGVRPADGDILCSGCAAGATRWLDADALGWLQELARPDWDHDPAIWPRIEARGRQRLGRILHESMTHHLPGYRLPQSLYWLAPASGAPGTDR
jgi:DNA repair protein RecO (recombination protein O)